MIPEFNSENHVKNLPDAYKKTNDSNNYKILEIERSTLNDLRDVLNGIDSILNLDEASGKTLDLYGERVGQLRGIATDDQYRLMIRAKIARNLSNGSYPSILNALAITFNCDPSEISIVESENESCKVTIERLPLSVIIRAGFTASQTLQIVKAILPVTVLIDSYLFEGTFTFSDAENEYDEEAGFCDVEDGTIGGFLGITPGDMADSILPI